MKTHYLYHGITVLSRVGIVAASILAVACSSGSNSYSSSSSSSTSSSNSSSSSSGSAVGFKAVINDFVDYKDWDVVDYAVGASNPFIGGAHGEGADSISRKTFMNPTASGSQGDFVKGSILIKEVFTYSSTTSGMEKTLLSAGGLVAMVKRGEGFNAENNGWEWFVIDSDLSSVASQGADIMGGACNGCHSKADTQMGGVDYVFPKPTEVIVANEAFADYARWDLIEHDLSPSNLSSGAHVDNADLRRVYQKQVLANPTEAMDYGYPVGTMLAKDISADGEVKQIVAMIKRGGSFDVDNGNWEYFVLDASDPSKVVVNDDGNELRGALAVCIACHKKATGDSGMDFVFKHADAPFNTNTVGEFVANKAMLTTFADWPLIDYAVGVSNPFIGEAHSGLDPEFARAVYENGTSASIDGAEYPVGSIVVKETFTTSAGDKVHAAQGGVLAMVKRGGSFNPDSGGWEWLVMSAEGDLIARGANLMGGACNGCHSKAAGDAGIDYVFNKPSEKVATLEDFVSYKSWALVGENTGASMANGHTAAAIRRTYKMPATASPYLEAGEYPVGTILTKEIIVDGEVTTIYAMVKRGGNYNPEHGDWQWFIVEGDLSGMTDMGVGSGCTGCHGKAGSEAETDDSFMGKDYVFYHSDDPVPMDVISM